MFKAPRPLLPGFMGPGRSKFVREGGSQVLRKNTEKVVIFLKNDILGRRWAPV